MKSRITYICSKLDIHHSRILKALELEFEIELYLTENCTEQVSCSGAVVVYSPLSVNLDFFIIPSEVKVIGISMAFDLNHEILERDKSCVILKNLRRSIAVIVDSDLGRSSLEEIGFHNKVEVIPYGCDQDIWKPESNRRFVEMSVISTRTWNDIHNNELLIQAIALSPILQDYKFSIASPGKALKASLIEKYGIFAMRNVHFHEVMDPIELKSYTDEFTFYVSTSISDGSSISLLECMSAGMICIVSDFESNREWIVENNNGLLFQNNCVDSLVNVLESLNSIDNLARECISKSAIDSVQLKADWRLNSRKITEWITFIEREESD